MEPVEELARSDSERGEMVLGRRDDGALELRVNGVFVMDTAETSAERRLATSALVAVIEGRDTAAAAAGLRVLIGGLGLGFTLREVLAHPRVEAVVVAEIEPDLVNWHRHGLVPSPDGMNVLDDPRVVIEIGDVRALVAGRARASYDLILLDVDNGPGFLVYDSNAEIYGSPFLRECSHLVEARRGVVAIWSADTSPQLTQVMQQVFDVMTEELVPVRLAARETTYHLFVGSTAVAGRCA
jgi:spermidine synthase